MLRVFCGGKLAVEVLRMADGGRENGRARVRDGNTMVMSLGPTLPLQARHEDEGQGGWGRGVGWRASGREERREEEREANGLRRGR